MMSSEEIYYTIALTRMTGFNQQIALLLYQTLGSSQAVYEHRNHIGDAVPETTPQLRESLKHWDDALRRAAAEIEFIEKGGIRALTLNDEDYPQRLRPCPDAPILLYYRGTSDLNQQRIISFIPRSKVPQITYRTRRMSTEEIYLSPAVYEERLEQYKERIQQVISYATNDQICRSRQLLRYFGEERSTDCRQCDVCITHSSDYLSEEKLAPYKQKILKLLADKKRHHITELKQIEGYNDLLDMALEYLIHEEIIYIDGSYIFTT